MSLCTDDVLQLGSCDQTDDVWHLFKMGRKWWGFGLGADNKYIACWDTGIGWQGPYKADGQPLRKQRFKSVHNRRPGCIWLKVYRFYSDI